jgi:putative aminopeptidase FrvX
MNKELLKRVLSIPTYFSNEILIQNFLLNYGKSKGYITCKDNIGNIYFTKGKVKTNEYFPLVCSHIDSVFSEHEELILLNKSKTIIEKNGILIAINPLTGFKTGLAADDLTGAFICLEIMNKIDNIKACFFVQEEFGCKGSLNSDKKFFKDVGYVMEFDAPTSNWYSEYVNGVKIFTKEFDNIVNFILKKYKVNNYSYDPYTDVYAISKLHDMCCVNLPTGYYNWHSNDEYIILKDVENGINIGIEYINILRNEKYINTDNDLII